MNITFPRLPTAKWDLNTEQIVFPAVVDGDDVECLITKKAILQRFGLHAGRHPTDTFGKGRQAIEAIAETMIEDGRVKGGKLVIGLNDV